MTEPRWIAAARAQIGQREIHGRRHNPRILQWWVAIRAPYTNDDYHRARPTLVFATLGQARVNRRLTPEDEGTLFARLLRFWALKTTLDTSYECAVSGTRLRDARLAALEIPPSTDRMFH